MKIIEENHEEYKKAKKNLEEAFREFLSFVPLDYGAMYNLQLFCDSHDGHHNCYWLPINIRDICHKTYNDIQNERNKLYREPYERYMPAVIEKLTSEIKRFFPFVENFRLELAGDDAYRKINAFITIDNKTWKDELYIGGSPCSEYTIEEVPELLKQFSRGAIELYSETSSEEEKYISWELVEEGE